MANITTFKNKNTVQIHIGPVFVFQTKAVVRFFSIVCLRERGERDERKLVFDVQKQGINFKNMTKKRFQKMFSKETFWKFFIHT